MALQSFTVSIGALRDVNNNDKNYVSGEAIYVKTIGGSFAPIFRDLAGTSEIAQDGLANQTSEKGQFTFFVEAGDYVLEYQSQSTPVTIVGPDYFNNRVEEIVNQIIIDTSTSRGFRVVGDFASGFTYELPNDVAIDGSGNYWVYADINALPVTVSAGTTPSEPTYTQVTFNQASAVTTEAGISAQKFIDNFELKIFQSPTDNLTKVTTFAGGVVAVYEVRKTSDNSLANIYSDKDGVTEIVQDGTANVSNGDAEAVFYIADGNYTVTIDAISSNLLVGYGRCTVSDVNSGLYDVGSKLVIEDRNNSNFEVVSGGFANGFDIIDAGSGNTAVLKYTDEIENFGGLADGAFDNAPVIQYLSSSGYSINFKSGVTYRVADSFNLSNGTKFFGRNTTLLCDHSVAIGTIDSNCYIGGFIVDGDNNDHTSTPFTPTNLPAENIKIGDIEWRNFHGISAFQTYPLYLPMYGCPNFQIGNQRFINITQDDDGAVTGKGFVGGLYLVGRDADVIHGKSYGKIGNVYGDTIKTVDGGLGVVQDADLIRGFAETPTTEKFDVTIGDVTGRNVAKRLVKGSSFGNVTIGNVTAYNLDPSLPMHSVVECLGTTDSWKFGNITGVGYGDRVCWFKGDNNTAGNVFDGFGSQAVRFGATGDKAKGCSVGNVTGLGDFATKVAQGTGVIFDDQENCSSGNILDNFAIAVSSTSANTGRGSVKDILCNGRVELVYGAISVNNISANILDTPVGGVHYALGSQTEIVNADIETDGRVTMSISDNLVDVSLGHTKIKRISGDNGVEANHSIFTTASSGGGKLRGTLEIESNFVIPGTPTGTSGKSLAYLTNIDLIDFSLSVDVTAATRGATGYGVYMNAVTGQCNRVSHRGDYGAGAVGMLITGDVSITKAEQLVDSSTLTLSSGATAFLVEKRSTVTVSGTSVVTPANTNR